MTFSGSQIPNELNGACEMRIKLLWAINLALAVSVFFAGALLASKYIVWRYAPSVAASVIVTEQKTQVSETEGLTRYESIGESGLFGADSIFLLDKPDVANTGFAGITLLGTVLKKSDSYAIFQDTASRKQELFKTGDMVFNYGKLTIVEKNMVVVRSAGKDKTFYMPDGALNSAALSGAGLNALTNSISAQTGATERLIDKRLFDNVFNDMSKVLGDARLQPYSEGGRVKGFSVKDIKPDGVFGLIGLKDGDVLLRINDFEINSLEKGMQLLGGLKGETKLALDVVRDGKPLRLSFRIQ